MMCADTDMIREVAYVNESAEKIMQAFMPGALTVILKKREELPDFITNGKDTVAIRIPDDPFVQELIRKTGKPLLVTSANLSGHPSLYPWKDVYRELSGKISCIVMADAKSDMPSTIIDLTGEPKILREGPLTKEELFGVL